MMQDGVGIDGHVTESVGRWAAAFSIVLRDRVVPSCTLVSEAPAPGASANAGEGGRATTAAVAAEDV